MHAFNALLIAAFLAITTSAAPLTIDSELRAKCTAEFKTCNDACLGKFHVVSEIRKCTLDCHAEEVACLFPIINIGPVIPNEA